MICFGNRLSMGSATTTIMVVLALAYFTLMAFYRIELPGLYYDEALFVPVSLRVLGECDVDAAVRFSIGCFPVRQSPFYVGALKAWLQAPVFAVFGVSPATIRIPMLLIAAVTLLLTFRFLRPRLGPWAAVAALILMATDPVFIFHSRIDWGPFVLATLFKLLALGFTLKWLEDGRTLYLVWALATLLLGYFDKLNFLWFIVALGGAVAMVYPRRAWRWLVDNPQASLGLGIPFVVVVGAVTGLAFYVARVALPAAGHQIGGTEPFNLTTQFAKVWALYQGTFDGSAQYTWMFARPLAISTWVADLLAPQILFGTLVSVALLFRRTAPFGGARLLAFINALVALLLVSLVATKEVGGSHHLVMLWPFNHVHLILCGIVIIDWLQGVGKQVWAIRISAASAALLVALIVAQQVQVGLAYARALDPVGTYNPRFDPTIYPLADALNEETADLVISVDWGTHQPLVSLAPKHQRPIYRDYWPIFIKPPGIDTERDHGLLAGKRLIFVTHAEDKASSSNTIANFPKYLNYWQLCPDSEKVIPGTDGRPLFHIVRVTQESNCGTRP